MVPTHRSGVGHLWSDNASMFSIIPSHDGHNLQVSAQKKCFVFFGSSALPGHEFYAKKVAQYPIVSGQSFVRKPIVQLMGCVARFHFSLVSPTPCLKMSDG